MDRWRNWTAPVEVVDDPNEVIVEEGIVSRSFNVKWPEEVVLKIRHGYQCLKCMEPQPAPFPERCGNPYCGYPMRKEQPHDFDLEFVGSEQFVGDAQRDWKELERLDERAERNAHTPGASIAVPSIWTPRGSDA